MFHALLINQIILMELLNLWTGSKPVFDTDSDKAIVLFKVLVVKHHTFTLHALTCLGIVLNIISFVLWQLGVQPPDSNGSTTLEENSKYILVD